MSKTPVSRAPFRGSNRTFMELKFSLSKLGSSLSKSSNRTFMELKSPHKSYRDMKKNVLIVPLWN